MYYSMTEIFKKYNLTYARGGSTLNKINALKAKGIIIEEVPSNFIQKKIFKIVDDSIFNQEWVSHPTLPYELTKNCLIRNKDDKRILTLTKDKQGYLRTGSKCLSAHRLLMETFKPIENSENYVVDHINGIRNDNRLENLRWVFQERNNQLGDEHQTTIKAEIARLIQKYGYTDLLNKLKKL